MKKELNFKNDMYGECKLRPLNDISVLRSILTTQGVLSRSSLGDLPNREISDERITTIYKQIIKTHEIHGISIYEILCANGKLLGLAGFFCETEKEGKYLELCWYILPEYQNKKLARDSGDCLLEYFFIYLPEYFSENIYLSKSNLCLTKIIADAFPDNVSTHLLEKFGFSTRENDKQFTSSHTRQHGQIRYELTRKTWALYRISQIIKKERYNLHPRIFSLEKINMERTRHLWFKYFGYGVMLCNGGVEKSIFPTKTLIDNNNINTFNMYRSDRSESTPLEEEDMKRFLYHEGVISEENQNDLDISFSFGGHEGYTRILRCIYKENKNTGILYPKSGYGFLAVSAATLKPNGYSIRFVNNNMESGEKITPETLLESIKKYKLAKTLFLELKTIAGAIYTKNELIDIINICKKNQLFLIIDVAHINMELSDQGKYPEIPSLCLAENFHEFSIIYTGSKTYGLERGRVGFVVFSKKIQSTSFYTFKCDLYRVLGSGNDLPFELAYKLINLPKENRTNFLNANKIKYKFNMNLMLAYIEGVNSKLIDKDMYEKIREKISLQYSSGIPGVTVCHKPLAGIQMKINISALKNSYFYNINIFNSEIFCYLLHSVFGVATLHSYQIMDPSGFNLRLSFSRELDVHNGMQALHDFVKLLSISPTTNPFMEGVDDIASYIKRKNEDGVNKSYGLVSEDFIDSCKNKIRKKFMFYSLPEKIVDDILNHSAQRIQSLYHFKYNR